MAWLLGCASGIPSLPWGIYATMTMARHVRSDTIHFHGSMKHFVIASLSGFKTEGDTRIHNQRWSDITLEIKVLCCDICSHLSSGIDLSWSRIYTYEHICSACLANRGRKSIEIFKQWKMLVGWESSVAVEDGIARYWFKGRSTKCNHQKNPSYVAASATFSRFFHFLPFSWVRYMLLGPASSSHTLVCKRITAVLPCPCCWAQAHWLSPNLLISICSQSLLFERSAAVAGGSCRDWRIGNWCAEEVLFQNPSKQSARHTVSAPCHPYRDGRRKNQASSQ